MLPVILGSTPIGTQAQRIVGLMPRGGQVEFRTYQWWYESFRRSVSREVLRYRIDGFFVEPAIANFELEFRPQLEQTRFTPTLESTGSSTGVHGSGRALSGSAVLRVLPERPLSAYASYHLYSDRYDDNITGPVATRRSFFTTGMRYDNRLMPLEAEYTREDWGSPSSAIDAVDGFSNTAARLSGSNRKTSFSLEQRQSGADQVTTQRIAQLRNRQRWGKGSSLETAFRFDSRGGPVTIPWERIRLNFRVQLRHTKSVSSQWQLQETWGGAAETRERREFLSGGLNWGVTRGFRVGLNGHKSVSRSGDWQQSFWAVQPNVAAGTALGGWGRWSLSGRIGIEDFAVARGQGETLVVAGEEHVVGSSRSFDLNERNADPLSVRVFGAAGQQYALGVDYDLFVIGGRATVTALPAGRIRVGDALTIDYQYTPSVRAEGQSLVGEVSSELRIGSSVGLYHYRWFQNPSGDFAGASTDAPRRLIDNMRTGVSFDMVRGTHLSMNFRAEIDRRIDDGLRSTGRSVSAHVGLYPVPQVALSAAGQASRVLGNEEELTLLSGTGSVSLFLLSNLRIDGTTEVWRSDRSPERERKTQIIWRLRAEWRPRQLQMYVDLQHATWQDMVVLPTRDATRRSRLAVGLVRRF